MAVSLNLSAADYRGLLLLALEEQRPSVQPIIRSAIAQLLSRRRRRRAPDESTRAR